MDTEKKRYSDAELEEFRQLINEKLEKANQEYEALLADISSEETEPGQKHNVFEDSTSYAQKEEAERLATRQKQFIDKLKAALVRIDNKTYGVCRVTGELIPKERLRAVPHATLSIEAKNQK